MCEPRVQTGPSIVKTSVNRNVEQETGLTGPGGKLSIDLIMLLQREELTGEFLFSCTSTFLQYSPGTAPNPPQVQAQLLVF